NVSIPLSEIFEKPTIRELSAYIKKAAEETFFSIEPAKKKDHYQLSSAQKRLFFLQRMEAGSTVYNINETVMLEGAVDRNKLEETFRRVIFRHESLRTSFDIIDEEPVQEIHAPGDIEFSIEYYEEEAKKYSAETTAGIIKQFIRPFELSHTPLIRIGLIKPGEPEHSRHILILDMHHIIADGTSIRVFEKEFMALYSGEELEPPKVQYKDYSEWQNSEPVKEEIREQEDYWLKQYVGELPVLNLPYDYSRPTLQRFEGNREEFTIGVNESRALYTIAGESGATLYMVVSALFYIFLCKLSGSEDIVLGTPTAGRRHADLEDVIGMFVNTLCIRNRPEGRKTFREFLREVKGVALEAFKNQEYPFEELVESVVINRDTARNPIFDVMFVLQNVEVNDVSLPDLTLSPYPYEHKTAKFDINLEVIEKKDKPHVIFEYSTALFKKETIGRFISYFMQITASVIKNPGQEIYKIDILPEAEKQRLLIDFNQTAVEYPKDKTIYRLFQQQVEKTPEKEAVRVSGKERVAQVLTYRELNERTNRLARQLRRKGVKANTVVGIMLERSVELIEAIYAVLKSGAAYLPIDPGYPAERIDTMLKQGKASILLTGRENLEGKNFTGTGENSPEIVIPTELTREINAESGDNLQPLSAPEDLIYIIFTSGSTGMPKGAGVYQRSFVNLINWYVKDFQLEGEDRNLVMTSFSFDLTQKNFYASLVTGGTICLPAVNDFEPSTINRDISRHKITWINCTPSMFFQLLDYSEGENYSDLESLRYVYLGGEPLSMNMFMKWVESEHCRAEIVNTYGPTECTDISNSHRITDPGSYLQRAVPVGKPVYNVHLYVLDSYLQPVPEGVIGELCIGGESVGIGYVNDPAMTKEKFVKGAFFPGEPGKRIYRTGDRARWLPDGTVEFIGRIDHQVKIRGFRIEIGEIENRLLSHEQIKEVVVIAKEGEGDKHLCAYMVLENRVHDPGREPAKTPGIDISALREYLAETLPDYMLPTYYVPIETIPLNPNGKVDLKALAKFQISGFQHQKQYIAPRNKTEEKLVAIWAALLAIDKDRIGIDDGFFQLGGHSLKATQMLARIHKEFNATISLAELFKTPTVKALSAGIQKAAGDEFAAIKPAAEKNYYHMSSSQKRMYVINKADSGSTAYNMPVVMTIEGKLEKNKLERVFQQLIMRHESFRTTFEMRDGEAVQIIHNADEIGFGIHYYESAGAGSAKEEITEGFLRPFDLSRAPLLRVGVIKTEKNLERTTPVNLFMLDMHHIISDGVSFEILTREFMELYAGKELKPLLLQYKDYAEWQNLDKEKERIKKQETYWLEQFAGDLPALNLPMDYPRPAVQSSAGSALFFRISEEETAALKEMALEHGATLFMLFLSLFNSLLSKLTGQEDIIVGTPTAGRGHADLAGIIGMFVNTLGMRNYPGMEKTAVELLENVVKTTLGAFENQDYQLEELVETLGIRRDVSRSSLFDVMFLMQNINVPQIEIPGLKLKPSDYENKTAKFDLMLQGMEIHSEMEFMLQYRTTLFKEETIRRYITYFLRIVSAVLKNRGELAEIEILSPEEKRQLLYDFNDTAVAYPAEKNLHQLFEEQAQQTPDRIAIVGAERLLTAQQIQLTYRCLKETSHRQAELLIGKGQKNGTITGIIAERSIRTIAGILGILKAGGAYMPIDPDYPSERIRYMLRDSGAKIVLKGDRDIPLLWQEIEGVEILDMRESEGALKEQEGDGGEPFVPTEEPAPSLSYIIYTSGSTGKPKG
ncbi:MAG: amino acid adenylation domain-containing protein, partial [bacterium]|nr:amino acid adenylation domain-containing protein [bacterium]